VTPPYAAPKRPRQTAAATRPLRLLSPMRLRLQGLTGVPSTMRPLRDTDRLLRCPPKSRGAPQQWGRSGYRGSRKCPPLSTWKKRSPYLGYLEDATMLSYTRLKTAAQAAAQADRCSQSAAAFALHCRRRCPPLSIWKKRSPYVGYLEEALAGRALHELVHVHRVQVVPHLHVRWL
jgi:hypothetical protein